MANNILTIDMVTKEALRVLHQELKIIPKVRRDYDDRFAKTGAKIGDSLRIRKPAKYRSTVGKTLVVQDSQEQFETLPVRNQRHIGMSFSSAEMALDIDSYSRQFIRPAMAQLAADVESEFLQYVRDNTFWTVGSPAANFSGLDPALEARRYLNDQLAPNSPRTMLLNNLAEATVVSSLSGLFQSSTQIKEQYEEGAMGRTAGFDWYSSSLMPVQTNGTAAFTTAAVAGAGQTGTELDIDGVSASGIITAGTVFTLVGVNAVHPESKADLGYPQQFVVTDTVQASAVGLATVSIQPAIVASGPFQNVTAAPANDADVVPVAAASTSYGLNFAFHTDSFAFATADLATPPSAEASRQSQDGLSLRAVRDYDIVNDNQVLRLDILYGYTKLYNQLAVKIANSPTRVP